MAQSAKQTESSVRVYLPADVKAACEARAARESLSLSRWFARIARRELEGETQLALEMGGPRPRRGGRR